MDKVLTCVASGRGSIPEVIKVSCQIRMARSSLRHEVVRKMELDTKAWRDLVLR